MLSTTDLLTISTMPNEKNLSLQTIQAFYKEHLCDRLFIFHLENEIIHTIKLRFEEANLCHLLGIQYVVQNLRNKYEYSGQKGYDKIENGTVTFDFLKKTHNKWYKSKRKRMLYFPFTHQIISAPTIIEYQPHNEKTNLKLDLIIYSHLDNTYLHLGLDKDKDSDYYYPKSFFDRKKDDIISSSTSIPVNSVNIIIDQKESVL
ncbi:MULTISPECIES: PBECR4 domain-containing protein [Bacillus]|uniref:PBECR4 domain-containing protein n=1 Tax=Bacillus TaxID=1386 RepID=UPI000304B3E6|nr:MULTISPECIES: PBECR4 domain-containing protein [Bacillus]